MTLAALLEGICCRASGGVPIAKLIAKPLANCNLRGMNQPESMAVSISGWWARILVCLLMLHVGHCDGLRAQSASALRVPWTQSKVTGHPGRPAAFDLERVLPAMTFENPVEMVSMPGTDWMWMVQLRGAIYAFDPTVEEPEKHLVFDLKSHVDRMSDAYGLAFHPAFQTNRQVYVCYVLGGGAPDGTRVSRFTVSDSYPPRILPESEEVLLTWKAGGHNGGCMRFGPDGYLYITTGDGTGPNPPDTLRTGQDISDLLSSVLRIDVDHQDAGLRYAIPADNPFVDHPNARPEVWAFGFRNPFKMSFDEDNGDLWVGDVGWELWELIHRVERGGNYGWSIMEGNHLVQDDLPKGPGSLRSPVVEHPHSEAASITGGYVYRGEQLSDLKGAYIYGDYETGKIWGLRMAGDRVVWHEELADAPFRVITFGEDAAGELFVVDYGGGLFQLKPHTGGDDASTFPQLLSQTGVFEHVAHQVPAPGVYPYTVAMPHWENGAVTRRWIGLPDSGRVDIHARSADFPENAVLVKTLFWPSDDAAQAEKPGHPIETQLLHFDGQNWHAYAYAWNAQGNDAHLVGPEGETIYSAGQDSILSKLQGEQFPEVWHYESRTNCLRCHNSWSGFALGWNALQLMGTHRASEDLSASWDRLTAFELTTEKHPRRVRAGTSRLDLEYQARSYLHANCGHCHRENAGAMVQSLMYFEKETSEASLIHQPTLRGDFGLPDAAVIVPGDPFRSVLYVRMAKTGGGQMPHLGMQGGLDVSGLDLMFQWIRSMDGKDSDQNNLTTEILQTIDQVSRMDDESTWSDRMSTLAESLPGVLGFAYALDHDLFNPVQRQWLQTLFGEMTDPLRRDVLKRFFDSGNERGDALDLKSLVALKPNKGSGRRMFFEDATLQCGTCHRVNGEGGALGPDLSRIRESYTIDQVIDHMKQPSLKVAPEFQVVTLETENDFARTGILKEETDDHYVLMDIQGQAHRMDKATVTELHRSTLSAMPEGLLDGRTSQEIADLLGFLGYLQP